MGLHDSNFTAQAVVEVRPEADHLSVRWGSGEVSRFHYQWLRDNCRSSERFDLRTGERKALIESVPAGLGAQSVEVSDGSIRIVWSDGAAESRFAPDWLRRNAYDAPAAPARVRTTWDAGYADAVARFTYDEVMRDDAAAADMIGAFETFGLVQLVGAPTAAGEVERFASRLAYVREIVFDRIADIRVEADPYTLGFTNEALPLHTDCSGYSWPPNVMVFHCLRNQVAGGASRFVDGARVVEELRERDPETLRMLTRYPVEFRLWSKQADTLSRRAPIILDDDGELEIIRYANWAVQPLRTMPFDLVPRWYDAWRALAERVNAPENGVRIRCAPGEVLLIDNHRVLHGRDAFDVEEGVRHFQQVYMERDDLSGFRRVVRGMGGAR
ncbi:TauD/TfdA family dioxygenase [Salinarimonas sp.]|uniref:TauD/TfdA family dioxygenase n=1 Tax=Salinarimonas sp. TaxID=2766526 RepID=UPI0032D96359